MGAAAPLRMGPRNIQMGKDSHFNSFGYVGQLLGTAE